VTNNLFKWIDQNIFSLGREMRLSYLPPLMVYVAYGISGLTGIVGTFFVKDFLGLSASFLAALGFWAGIPWALKMPIGHTVDLLWRWKSWLVGLGAGLLGISLGIMAALIGHREATTAIMPAEVWYVLSVLLAPIGYVIQDAVADAMTVEAVPRVDEQGQVFDEQTRKLMHTTMQTLGRVAIIGGTLLVALLNVVLFAGVEDMSAAEKAATYAEIYLLALVIPVLSVAGVILGQVSLRLRARRLRRLAGTPIDDPLAEGREETAPNWSILGGSLAFVAFTLAMGLGEVPLAQEITFAGSLAIVLFLIRRLVQELAPEQRNALIGTAVIIFVFRAVPLPGAGATWWQIDVLGFDQQFLSVLTLVTSTLTLAALFLFRRFVATATIAHVVLVLTLASGVLSLPFIGLYYGLHEWTARLTGGVVDARFIAVLDTALESPLSQIAMIPMLAWIARNAPANLKATFFAVMASFTNLALSASSLGTKYLNQIFVVTREVRDAATGAITTPADYTTLGWLLVAVAAITVLLPLATIAVVQSSPLRTEQ
jgi:hypothetical protein